VRAPIAAVLTPAAMWNAAARNQPAAVSIRAAILAAAHLVAARWWDNVPWQAARCSKVCVT
jgi:hypothetical protein